MTSPKLGELGPYRLGDAGRVDRQFSLGHGLGKQRVIDPEIADVIGCITAGPHALPPRHDLAQPLRRQSLISGLGRHIGVGREEVAEAAAAAQASRQQEGLQDAEPTHWYSVLKWCRV